MEDKRPERGQGLKRASGDQNRQRAARFREELAAGAPDGLSELVVERAHRQRSVAWHG